MTLYEKFIDEWILFLLTSSSSKGEYIENHLSNIKTLNELNIYISNKLKNIINYPANYLEHLQIFTKKSHNDILEDDDDDDDINVFIDFVNEINEILPLSESFSHVLKVRLVAEQIIYNNIPYFIDDTKKYIKCEIKNHISIEGILDIVVDYIV